MPYVNEFKMVKWHKLKNTLETLYMEEYFGDRVWTEMVNCLEALRPNIEEKPKKEEEDDEEYCANLPMCNCPECREVGKGE